MRSSQSKLCTQCRFLRYAKFSQNISKICNNALLYPQASVGAGCIKDEVQDKENLEAGAFSVLGLGGYAVCVGDV